MFFVYSALRVAGVAGVQRIFIENPRYGFGQSLTDNDLPKALLDFKTV